MKGYNNCLETEFIRESVEDYKLDPRKFGFVPSREDDVEDDGNSFKGYRYKGDGLRLTIWIMGRQGGISTRKSENEEFINLRIPYGGEIDKGDDNIADKYNGVPGFKDQAAADAALRELAELAEKYYKRDNPDKVKDAKPAEEGKQVVEIVQGSGKLRAVADDGEHGKAYVMFPNSLRTAVGVRYQVDGLRWNGKNYTVIGKPQILESQITETAFTDTAIDLIKDYLYNETGDQSHTKQEILDYIYNDVCDDENSDYEPTKDEIQTVIDRLNHDGYEVIE